jgi:hypothetical protein
MVRVNGKKLNDIHDVASKIDSMTRVIRLLAYLATALAVSAVLMCGGIGLWLLGNSYQIENTLNSAEDRFSKTSLTIRTQNNRMKNKLLSLGWHFNGKDWQQIVNTKLKPSK